MIFLKPIDEELLEKIAKTGKPIFTVEDGTINGGLGSAVSEWLSDNGYSNRMTRIGIPDTFVKHGTVPQLQKEVGLDSESIAERIANILMSCK